MKPGPYLLRGLLGVVAIVGLGVALGRSGVEGASSTVINESRFARVAVGSNLRHRVESAGLEQGLARAVFGGIDLDLRDAEIAGDSAVIDVRAVFGGINLRVPDDWVVESEVRAVFGGVSNRARTPPDEDAKRLRVRGGVAFGGLNIRN